MHNEQHTSQNQYEWYQRAEDLNQDKLTCNNETQAIYQQLGLFLSFPVSINDFENCLAPGSITTFCNYFSMASFGNCQKQELTILSWFLSIITMYFTLMEMHILNILYKQTIWILQHNHAS